MIMIIIITSKRYYRELEIQEKKKIEKNRIHK